MGCLLFDAPCETAEFIQSVLEAMMCSVQIDSIDPGSCLPPAAAGSAGNGRHHLQIPQ